MSLAIVVLCPMRVMVVSFRVSAISLFFTKYDKLDKTVEQVTCSD